MLCETSPSGNINTKTELNNISTLHIDNLDHYIKVDVAIAFPRDRVRKAIGTVKICAALIAILLRF